MKKIIPLALTALMMAGCNYTRTVRTTSDGKRVCIIDSCEYITYSNGYGQHYTHKGNCLFCAERRKQELKELVEQLKGK